jgi:hypothetical protein
MTPAGSPLPSPLSPPGSDSRLARVGWDNQAVEHANGNTAYLHPAPQAIYENNEPHPMLVAENGEEFPTKLNLDVDSLQNYLEINFSSPKFSRALYVFKTRAAIDDLTPFFAEPTTILFLHLAVYLALVARTGWE